MSKHNGNALWELTKVLIVMILKLTGIIVAFLLRITALILSGVSSLIEQLAGHGKH